MSKKVSVKDDFSEIAIALKKAEKEHLEVEVMATAMYYLKAYPSASIKTATDNAISVWIKKGGMR